MNILLCFQTIDNFQLIRNGNVRYRRINSILPIEDERKLRNAELNLIKANDDYILFYFTNFINQFCHISFL